MRAREPWVALVSQDLFWDYAQARHAAWRRRTLGLPPPWSRDPVLAGWRFPNVFRELDPGTAWLVAWQDGHPQDDVRDAATSVAAYRLIQRRETVERVGLPAGRADAARWAGSVLALRAAGERIASGMSAPRPLSHSLEAVARVGDADLPGAASGVDAHAALAGVFGLGPYYATQVLADLLGHPSWHLGPGEVVPLGHGARRGLSAVVTGEVPRGTHTRRYRAPRPLSDEEAGAYAMLVHDQRPIGYHRPLWPHEVEQTLCELGRYLQIRDGDAGLVHVARRADRG